MRIPDTIIESVRERVDIVSVVGRRVSLKRAGRNHVGLCPFHDEKTPSFYVSPDRRSYHCFGCGEGGDVFRFLCKQDGRAFPEVVRELAKEVGITIPEVEEDPEERAREAARHRLWTINEAAAAFFQAELAGPGGAEARAYLAGRDLTPGLAAEFELGFGGSGWDGLWKALGRTEQDRQDLVAAGLVVAQERGPLDRFRGRVIFPIRDEKNRLVGFGGRVFGERSKREGVAKYVNSSQSPVYDKSTVLYRLPQALARVRKGNAMVVVEGYFDAVALERQGLAAVATCGTALTPRHGQLLSRHKASVVLCWDGDQAGLRAVGKAAEVLLPAAIPTRVAVLPVGDDPDTYVARTGSEGAARLVDEAEPLPTYVISQAAAAAEEAGDDVPSRLHAVRSLSWLFRALPAGLERDLYLDQAAKRLGMARDQLIREFGRPAPAVAAPPEPPRPAADLPPPPPRPQHVPLTPTDKTAVRLALEHHQTAAALLSSAVAEQVSKPVLELLEAVRGLWQEATPPSSNVDGYLALRPYTEHHDIGRIFKDVQDGRRLFVPDAVDKAVRDMVVRANLQQLKQQRKSIQQEIAAHEGRTDGKDAETLERLTAQLREVNLALLETEKAARGDPAGA